MAKGNSLLTHESKFIQFDTLMQFRVKHILLVSSSYDSYVLEEDGQLTELIYNEYLELNLTITPHVRRAANAAEALEILKTEDIDLVIIFKRVSDIDVMEFGTAVKTIDSNMPVVLLAYHERELLAMMTEAYEKIIDYSFIWTGDVKILLAIIKLIEDKMNIDRDTDQVGVRVIIIVEDSVKFYSSYLPLLYSEIMLQTLALMDEGMNISHKILRMRARPKILLAQNFEQAMLLFKKYKKYLLGVISDFRFQIDGEQDDMAGIKLIQFMREAYPDLPVLMQSSADKNADIAYANNVGFLSKRSPKLHTDLRSFVMSHFGFGDFVFIDPDSGVHLARAKDFKSMEEVLSEINDKSLLYHARRNHFSNWLMARTEFALADKIRPKKASEFKNASDLRGYLIYTFRKFRHDKQLGEITNFSRNQFDLQSDFVRIGGGSLGGKGRGLAYINALLNKYKIPDFFDDVTIAVPKSIILGTDVFDDFIERNNLLEYVVDDHEDEAMTKRFQKARMPKKILSDLDKLLETVDYPLAVRSSSLLEDSHLQPFAGIYDTFMLPNNDPDPKIRRSQLLNAIKTIYASVYLKKTKAYHEAAGNRLEEEKMAVIIQKAIGTNFYDRFYPSFSGVALSYNYYSLDAVEPEDGVVYVALGFGKTIVEGMNCLRFSPSYPNHLPQLSTIKDMLNNSQREFYGLNLKYDPEGNNFSLADDGLTKYTLDEAEVDGTLYPICSTYSAENNRIYDGSSQKGARIVTFAPILKSKIFPLTDIVKFLLKLGSEGLNCPVEIEFAVDLNVPKGKPKEFYFLQVRPMIKEAQIETVELTSVDNDRRICESKRTLGNLYLNNITDIVLVRPDNFDRNQTFNIATEVGRLNKKLKKQKDKYLLIGPGRWGTTERWLGVPVTWDQISGAKVIMEAGYGDFSPDPSFGTHFFQNITAFQIGYFTVNSHANNGYIDIDWLLTQPIVEETNYLYHIKVEKPLEILIDGRVNNGIIARQD